MRKLAGWSAIFATLCPDDQIHLGGCPEGFASWPRLKGKFRQYSGGKLPVTDQNVFRQAFGAFLL